MIRGRIEISLGNGRKMVRPLGRHERFYNALLLVLSLMAFVSAAAMSAVGTIGTGMYFWIVLVLILGYWSYKR
jgi:hypothetical protein